MLFGRHKMFMQSVFFTLKYLVFITQIEDFYAQCCLLIRQSFDSLPSLHHFFLVLFHVVSQFVYFLRLLLDLFQQLLNLFPLRYVNTRQ